MPVKCTKCGKEFDRDPALDVPCLICHAGIGRPCTRRHPEKPGIHLRREYLAIERGFTERCTDGLLHDARVLEVGPLFQTQETTP